MPRAWRRSATAPGSRSSISAPGSAAPSPSPTSSRPARSTTRRSATSASCPSAACAPCWRRRSSPRTGCSACSRSTARSWASGAPTEIALAEAVAREAAVALDASRLLRDSNRRLAEQQALLKAGEALTSELHFDTVIERLVEELRGLVNADAADCWTLLPGRSELVCRAVLGLPEIEIGRTIPVAGTIGEAIATGKPVLRREFAETEQPPPRGSYAEFAEVMDAPIFSFGEIRGVLGVCSREPGRFEESDLRLIEAFASLASIALRNAEAYEESTRQAQVERGFYRIAAVLSEPLSEQETLDAVAQAAAEALGGDSAAVLRPAGAELELAGGYELSEALAAHLRRERVGAGSVRARRQGARLAAPPRGRPLRRGARSRRGGRRSWLAPGRSAPAARRRGPRAGARLLPRRAAVRRRAARARGAGGGGGARRARAQRPVRARAALAAAGAAPRPRRPRARRRARSGQRARPGGPERRPAARRRRCLGAGARRRRGRRPRGRGAGQGRCARHAFARRPPGSSATSSRRARRGRSPTSAATRGSARRTRCSPAATRATSACR